MRRAATGPDFSCATLVSSQERYWARHTPLAPPEERAATASPRTAWTAGRWVLSNWCRRHVQATAVAERHPRDHPAPRVVLLGDSIFEALALNTSHAAVLGRTIGERWPSPLVLAVGGDQTQHLLWRLQNGELSAAMASDPAVLFVLHIGTNNLGNYMGP